MNKEEIMKACTQSHDSFLKILDGETYQIRGIFNSEALLIVSLAKYLGVKHIIESGRARGHSTNLIAKFFARNQELKITSIDFDKNSNDAKYSEDYLRKYESVDLIYGNAHKVLQSFISQECIVFIDGPKGDEAIELTINILKDKRVRAVLLHDFHKNDFLRQVTELLFTETFFSDDKKFVEQFRNLDNNCWEVLENSGDAPYQRNGRKVESYAATLAVIFNGNNPVNELILNNYIKFKQQKTPTIKSCFFEWRKKIFN